MKLTEYDKEILRERSKLDNRVRAKVAKLYRASLDETTQKIEELVAKEAKLTRELAELRRLSKLPNGVADPKKIAASMERIQRAIQAKVFRRQFQEKLRVQIEESMRSLPLTVAGVIEQGIKESFGQALIGSNYALQRQGVPLVALADAQMAHSIIMEESRLSAGIYETLEGGIPKLADQIKRATIQTLITKGTSVSMAKRIQEYMPDKSYWQAQRIAKTEMGRVSSATALEVQRRAKSAGADVVKQWCSTLDANTRRSHTELDGQLRELEEPFTLGGAEAMAPHHFGIAEFDINCRCTILQRARWALDDEETERIARDTEGNNVVVKHSDAKDMQEFSHEVKALHEENRGVVDKAELQKVIREAQLNPMHRELLRRAEKDGNEHLFFLGANNELLGAYTGDKKHLTFTNEIMSFINIAPEKSLVAIHNHPSGSIISTPDLYSLATSKSIREIRVVGHNGKVYSIDLSDRILKYDEITEARRRAKDKTKGHKKNLKKHCKDRDLIEDEYEVILTRETIKQLGLELRTVKRRWTRKK